MLGTACELASAVRPNWLREAILNDTRRERDLERDGGLNRPMAALGLSTTWRCRADGGEKDGELRW